METIYFNVQKHDGREYLVVQDICAHFNCTDQQIFNRPGAARNLYIYCMVTVLGWKQKTVAKNLGMKTPNVSRDLKRFFFDNKGKDIEKMYPFIKKY